MAHAITLRHTGDRLRAGVLQYKRLCHNLSDIVAPSMMASRARAWMEVQQYTGKCTLLTSLACRECYERVGHRQAGDRVLRSGVPGRVANMVFDMSTSGRHVWAHGAMARPRQGNRGLVAGCAFAKDILKAFLAEPFSQCPEDHGTVDDITLQIAAKNPEPRGMCGADGGSLGQPKERPGSRQYGSERREAACSG